MMLAEAIANWKQEERRALVDAAAAKTVADMDRIVLRLDAAVRDVALAALQETRRRFSCASSGANLAWGFEVLDEVEDALKRRLLPEGSEGGKE